MRSLNLVIRSVLFLCAALLAAPLALSPAQARDRKELVEASYFAFFCRAPRPDEVEFWLNRIPADADDPDFEEKAANVVMPAHKNWIRTRQDEREATIRRAYLIGMVREPKQEEVTAFGKAFSDHGYSCHELLEWVFEFKKTGLVDAQFLVWLEENKGIVQAP